MHAHVVTNARRRAGGDGGFTVVELVVVVLFLVILALIALPNYFGTQADAQRLARTSTVAAINTAIALYQYRHNGACPGQAGQETFVAFLADRAYFPDGSPVDPFTKDDTTFVASYSVTTCRTR